MQNEKSYQKLILRGTPQQAGYSHGETLRNEIQDLFDARIKIITDLSGATLDTIETICSKIWHLTDSFLPDLVIELKATAQAANMKSWKLVVAGGFSDVLDLCTKQNNVKYKSSECTLKVCTLTDGRPLLIGTWDTHASAQNALVLIDRKVGNGPRTIALSTAGWPMQQGINEFGLSFAITNLGAKSINTGTSYIAALVGIASAQSSNSAATIAKSLPLCSARFFQFLDRSGNSIGIETDGLRFSQKSGGMTHTNHFTHDEMLELEGRPYILHESRGRQETMRKAILPKSDCISSVFDMIKAASAQEFPIIKNGKGCDDRTCAAFVISPMENRMWFTPGPPNLHEINSVSLD